MLQFQTLLHPTDFSPLSECAFQLACSLARDHGARLVVLHVTPTAGAYYGEVVTPPQPEIRDQIREELHRLKPSDPSVRVSYLLEESNDPAGAILDTAQATGCDLIVMGTHGRTGLLSRVLMGSVAERVVRTAPCPVMTVRAPQKAASA